MIDGARDFDATNELETAIRAQLGAEGVVLWSRDVASPIPGHPQRQLVAVVAGEDGPSIAMCRSWPGNWGGPVVRVDLSVPVAEACRKHLPERSGDGARAVPLDHRDPDTALAAAIDGSASYLARNCDAYTANYLLRVSPADGSEKRVCVATVDGRGDGATAEVGRSVTLSELAEWAAAEFGAAGPRP